MIFKVERLILKLTNKAARNVSNTFFSRDFACKNQIMALFCWFKVIFNVNFTSRSSKSQFRGKKCENMLFIKHK